MYHISGQNNVLHLCERPEALISFPFLPPSLNQAKSRPLITSAAGADVAAPRLSQSQTRIHQSRPRDNRAGLSRRYGSGVLINPAGETKEKENVGGDVTSTMKTGCKAFFFFFDTASKVRSAPLIHTSAAQRQKMGEAARQGRHTQNANSPQRGFIPRKLLADARGGKRREPWVMTSPFQRRLLLSFPEPCRHFSL